MTSAKCSIPDFFSKLTVLCLWSRRRPTRVGKAGPGRPLLSLPPPISVLLDICRLLLHDRFMVELLVPQPLGHVAALRTFFRDLAHASIMRLDDDSMSKMWDLMTMAVKQQALRADSPGELLQATLNHIEYMGEHVPGVAAEAEQARQGLLAVSIQDKIKKIMQLEEIFI